MAKAMQGPHELLLLCEAVLVNRIQVTCPHKCPRRGGARPSGNRHRDPAWPFPPLPASPPPAHLWQGPSDENRSDNLNMLHCLTVYDIAEAALPFCTCFLLFKVKGIATHPETSWFVLPDIYQVLF